MAEIVIIVLVIGILAAIAVPSFHSLYESVKVDQAIAELRASISQSQRMAIRGGQSCESSFLVQLQPAKFSFKPDTSSSCQSIQQSFPEGVSIFTNLVSTPMDEVVIAKSGWLASNHMLIAKRDSGIGHKFGHGKEKNQNQKQNQKKSWKKWSLSNCKAWGGCNRSDRDKIGIVSLDYGRQGSINYAVQNSPTSSTGTVVALPSHKTDGKMKCLAISRRIGLTRLGYYSGELTPAEMTENGKCTTVEWNKQ